MADFLVPLAIALSVLAGLTFLAIGLTSAPWPILLILLMIVLIGSKRLLNTDSGDEVPGSELSLTEETNQMTAQASEEVLIYRGIQFKRFPPSLERPNDSSVDPNEVLIYRGTAFTRSGQVVEQTNNLDVILSKYRQLPWKSPLKEKSDQQVAEPKAKLQRVLKEGRKVIPPLES